MLAQHVSAGNRCRDDASPVRDGTGFVQPVYRHISKHPKPGYFDKSAVLDNNRGTNARIVINCEM